MHKKWQKGIVRMTCIILIVILTILPFGGSWSVQAAGSEGDIQIGWENGLTTNWALSEGGLSASKDVTVTGATYVLQLNNLSFNPSKGWDQKELSYSFGDSLDVSAYSNLAYDLYVPLAAFKSGKLALKTILEPNWSELNYVDNLDMAAQPKETINGIDYAVIHQSMAMNGLTVKNKLLMQIVGQSADFSGQFYLSPLLFKPGNSVPVPPPQKEAPATDFEKPIAGKQYVYTFDTNNNGFFDAWGGAFQRNFPVQYSNDLGEGALRLNVNYTGGGWEEANIAEWLSGTANTKWDLSAYEQVEFDVFLPEAMASTTPNGILKLGTALDKNWYEVQGFKDYKLSEQTKVLVNGSSYFKIHYTAPLKDIQRTDSGQVVLRFGASGVVYSGPIYVDNVTLSTYKQLKGLLRSPQNYDSVKGNVLLEASVMMPEGTHLVTANVTAPNGFIDLTGSGTMYQGYWDTQHLTDGFYPLHLEVTNSANEVSTQDIEVFVKNSDLTITFQSPVAGETLHGDVEITAEIVATGGVAQATLEANGTQYPMSLVSGNLYKANVDTTTLPDGVTTLVIDAKDAVNRLTTDFMDVMVQNRVSSADFVRREGSTYKVGDTNFYFVGYNTYNLPFLYPNMTSISQKIVTYTTNGRKLEKIIPKNTDMTFEHMVDLNFSEARKAGLTVARTWMFNTDLNDANSFYQGSYDTFNEAQFKRFDYILASASRYGIRVIPTLSNYWGDYGGMRAITKHLGIATLDFFENQDAQTLYKNYIQYAVNRTNTLNHVKYKDDPTILAWDLMNEPRMDYWDDATPDKSQYDPTGARMADWLQQSAAYVKSVDPNHLVMAGGEGQGYQGFGGSGTGFSTDPVGIQASAGLDAVSYHPYPNQSWSDFSYFKTDSFITNYAKESLAAGKPVVLQEYGLSVKQPIRDLSGHAIEPGTSDYQAIKNVWYKMIQAEFRRAGGSGSNLWMFQAYQLQEHEFGISTYVEPKTAEADRAIVQMLGQEGQLMKDLSGKVLFPDTKNDQRLGYINEAAHLGYMSGTNGDFHADTTVSSQDFVEILKNAKLAGGDFTTSESGALTASKALAITGAALHIAIDPVSLTTLYDKNKGMTRGEIAEWVVRLNDIINPAGEGTYVRYSLSSTDLANVLTKTLVKESVLTAWFGSTADNTTSSFVADFKAQIGASIRIYAGNTVVGTTIATGNRQVLPVSLPLGVYTKETQLTLVATNAIGEFDKIYLPKTTIIATVPQENVGGPVPGTSQQDKHTSVVSEDSLEQSKDGEVVVQVPTGTNKVQLPLVVADILGTNKLIIQSNDTIIQLPTQVLKRLKEMAAQEGMQDAQILLGFVEKGSQDQDDLLKRAETNEGVKLAPASAVFEFSLRVVSSDGREHILSKFEQPITISFAVSRNASKDLIGVYYVGEQGELDYVPSETRNGYLIANISHFSSYAVLAYRKTFDDVSTDHWGLQAIQRMAAKHIMVGTTAHAFEPDRPITRAEFTAIVVRALGLKSLNKTTFVDTHEDDWYAEALSAANDAKLINGFADGQFRPDTAITRQEMAVIALRAYEISTGQKQIGSNSAAFADGNDISHWAVSYVNAAFAAKLVQGQSANKFAPLANLTRAEAAQLISNLIDKER